LSNSTFDYGAPLAALASAGGDCHPAGAKRVSGSTLAAIMAGYAQRALGRTLATLLGLTL
ncbi:MAG: hypothetical protein ABJE10_15665, partial [bacterium]